MNSVAAEDDGVESPSEESDEVEEAEEAT